MEKFKIKNHTSIRSKMLLTFLKVHFIKLCLLQAKYNKKYVKHNKIRNNLGKFRKTKMLIFFLRVR